MKNNKLVVLLSGEIASGKSTLSQGLREKYNFIALSSREALNITAIRQGKKDDRDYLQKLGQKIDTETNGAWIRDAYQTEINSNNRVVLDAVRILPQIEAFRHSYGHAVVHVHLKASSNVLKKRFLDRGGSGDTKEKYENYKKDKTEKEINTLEDKADIIIQTDECEPNDILLRVVSFLKLLPSLNQPLVDILVGGQFGSEGKGQVAAYMAPEYDCLVRVGGPNAGHKVYSEPESHVFHILPSGVARNKTAKIIIGPGAVISIETILKEIRDFQIDDPSRLIIDSNATIISKSDIAFEAKYNKIGSTGQGVGAATMNNIINRLKEQTKYKAINCKELKAYIGSSHGELENIFSQNKKILLEGTQGTFLSLHHGYYPYVTSRETTAGGCIAEAGIAINRVRKIIMVTRTYPIRVQNPDDGTSGPFLSKEITWKDVSQRSGIPLEELSKTEKTSTTKKDRRVAEFSWELFRKACELNSPTDIALTFSDYISVDNRKARRYDQLTPDTTRFIDEIERCSEVPVSLISTRFNYRAIIDRRTWI